MTQNVYISPRATAQVLKAATWWHEHRPAAPGAVDLDLQDALHNPPSA